MSLATWKDLCIDAVDAHRLADFWGAALGLSVERRGDGHAVLRGDHPTETIWVNAVPEPKTVKHRVHLDVRARSLDPLLDLGATVVAAAEDTGKPWTTLADPDGGEFCTFLRDDLPAAPPARRYEMVVDVADGAASEALATWWADVLGGRVVDDGRGFWWIEDIPGLPFETIDMIPVPEPKAVKNRIHWDVDCDDVDALVGAGATVLAAPTPTTRWTVCADPQGNEFCAFTPGGDAA
ncbi:VOC family protein [Euzebya sp.]|uniref:VOC family protein n=1 Tax=Euzebya sp. TaxID=1971409 RepID=UPI003514D3B6